MTTSACPSCGFANPNGMKFCGECGAPLSRVCPHCTQANPPEFKFCGQCGTAIASALAPKRGAPNAYTPKHLADKVLTSRAALEGERKQVTVLFADVKGSMELAGQVDPERWHEILDRFFEILTEGVHRFEGTVNQYTGDGIMALFGAPIAHEDHARRACYAALHLREELDRYGLELRRESGLSFAFRMGINSGDVVVGRIGDDLRMDYTAQGSTVGLAQRMEQLAEANSAYLAPNTARQVEGYFDLENKGEFRVKGVATPMLVHALRGLGRLRTRLQVSQSRGFSKFVGRVDEMNTLERALKHALDGHGEVVGVVGEAGVGKSRLCYEFTESCRARGVPVYEAHCPAHGKTIPFLPVFDLLRNYFGVSERDSSEAARKKIAGTLVLLDKSFQESLPLIFDFLGVNDPARPSPSLDPEARQRQLFGFIRQLVFARSEHEPAVIFVDDLHWIDPASDAFFAQLIEFIDQTRSLLLLNFRPEYDAEWTNKTYYQQLPVVPLGPDAIRELTQSLLGDDPTLAGLASLIHKRTRGNPFFTEEVIQALAESGTLAGSRGAYKLTAPIGSLQVPETVRAILAARIDRLKDDSKRVLQTAAVIGKEFLEPILKGVCDVPETELGLALRTLRSAEFVFQQSLYPVVEYAFKHPLTQEVALETQLNERRRQVHAKVARAIIAATPDKLNEQSALIAYHFDAADERLDAARWHRRAAKWLTSTDALGGAGHWRRVLEISRKMDPSDEIDTLRLEACKALLNLESWRLGMSMEEAEQLVAEGRTIADRREDIDSIASLEASRCNQYWVTGDLRAFAHHAQLVRDLVPKVRDEEQRLALLVFLAYPDLVRGEIGEGLRAIEKVRDMVRRGDFDAGIGTAGFSAYAWQLGLLPMVRAWIGDLSDAAKGLEEAIRQEREAGVIEPLTWAYANRAVVAFLQGLDGPACQHIEAEAVQGVALSRDVGNRLNVCYSLIGMGAAHLQCGRFAEAVRALEECVAIIHEHRVTVDQEAEACAFMSLALLGLGDVDSAVDAAERAVSSVERTGAELWRSLATLAQVKSLMAKNEPARAAEVERLIDEGLQHADHHGIQAIRPQLVECRAHWAASQGDPGVSHQLLADALAQYRAMGATGHAQRLENLLTE